MKLSFCWILCSALAPAAAAQISFPAGQVYGYSMTAFADTTLGTSTSDAAFSFNVVTAGQSAINYSDFVLATALGNASSQGFDPPCTTGLSASVGDLGPNLPGTHYLQVDATSNSIQASIAAETRHTINLSDDCCVVPNISAGTDEGGIDVGTTALVPFAAANTVTVRVEDVSVVKNFAQTVAGTGMNTWVQDASVRVELFRLQGGTWVLIGSLSDSQFAMTGQFAFQLNPGIYGVAVIYEQDESLDATLTVCPGAYSVTTNATHTANVKLAFL